MKARLLPEPRVETQTPTQAYSHKPYTGSYQFTCTVTPDKIYAHTDIHTGTQASLYSDTFIPVFSQTHS